MIIALNTRGDKPHVDACVANGSEVVFQNVTNVFQTLRIENSLQFLRQCEPNSYN